MYEVEKWWRELDCFDREVVSGIPYNTDPQTYRYDTDDWWDTLTEDRKIRIYNDAFYEI